MFKRRPPVQEVMGHRIAEPRMTWQAWVVIGLAVSVPVLVLGSLLDALMQAMFGLCTGLWCW